MGKVNGEKKAKAKPLNGEEVAPVTEVEAPTDGRQMVTVAFNMPLAYAEQLAILAAKLGCVNQDDLAARAFNLLSDVTDKRLRNPELDRVMVVWNGGKPEVSRLLVV